MNLPHPLCILRFLSLTANLGLFRFGIKAEDVRAELNTGLTAYTLICINGHFIGHGHSPSD